MDMGMILVKGYFQLTHSLLDPVLERPFGLLEVVLALVHCPKVTVVGEHLQYGHDHGVNDAENANADDGGCYRH